MRPFKFTQTGVGVTNPCPVNIYGGTGSFKIGLGAIVTGTATYTVEHTFDNVLRGDTPRWFPNATLQNMTTSADGNYAFPIAAIRLNVTAGTGTVELIILTATGGL